MKKLSAYYTPNLREPDKWERVTIYAFIANIDCSIAVIFEVDDGHLDEATLQHFRLRHGWL